MHISHDQKMLLKQRLGDNDLSACEACFVNLDDYRTRLGDEWPVFKNILLSITRDAIRGAIAPDDILIATQKGYGVIFAETPTSLTAEIRNKIQEELDRAISQRDEFSNPPVAFHVAPVESKKLLALASLVEIQDPKSQASDLDADGISLLAELCDEADREHYVQLVEECYKYYPIWAPKHNSIIATRLKAANRRPRSFVQQNEKLKLERTFLLNVALIEKALRDAAAIPSGYGAVNIIVPVKFEAYCWSKFRKNYRRLFLGFNALEKIQFWPCLDDIPLGTPVSAISDATNGLSAAFQRYVVEAPFNLENLDNFIYSGAFAIAFEAPSSQEVKLNERSDEIAFAIGILKAHVAKIHSFKSFSLIHNIETNSGFLAAMNVATDLMAGPFIGNEMKLPCPARVVSAEQLVQTDQDNPQKHIA